VLIHGVSPEVVRAAASCAAPRRIRNGTLSTMAWIRLLNR
jgi:hypothetical protein